jgi:simple sugar transport system substrate-binding protein
MDVISMTGHLYMMNWKFLPLLVCAVSLSHPLTTLAQRKPKIVMVTHGQAADSFWLIVRNGAEAAAAETNSDLEYRSPENFDLAAMAQLIDTAVASKPDGLILSIPDAAVLGRSIQAAVAAKIPVISINSGLEVSKRLGCLMHIGQLDEPAGKKAGERLKALGVKNAVILDQEVGNAALEQRIKGFREGFEGPFHHVQVLPVTIDFKQCQDTVSSYLGEYPSIDGIVALGPIVAEPALQAVDQAGRTGKIKVCTFDISPAIVAALVKNQVEFAIDQQEWLQGYLPVVFLANYARYGSILENDLILTGPSFVTPANAQKVMNPLSLGFH